jgi:hypothetical protein
MAPGITVPLAAEPKAPAITAAALLIKTRLLHRIRSAYLVTELAISRRLWSQSAENRG